MTVDPDRVVVAQPPFAPPLVHNRPRMDGRRLEHLVDPRGWNVLHGARHQGTVGLSDALRKTLSASPRVERHLRRPQFHERVDAHPPSRHDLIYLGRQADIPLLPIPRDRHVRASSLRRLGFLDCTRAVQGIHLLLQGTVVEGVCLSLTDGAPGPKGSSRGEQCP